jgi:hypothetical protein
MRTFVAFRTAGRSKETHADPERHKASGVIRLLKERLMPYWRQIVLVLALLFVQAITNLYLPTLNADLINNGIVKGDTH